MSILTLSSSSWAIRSGDLEIRRIVGPKELLSLLILEDIGEMFDREGVLNVYL